jgi:hypothetical protein
MSFASNESAGYTVSRLVWRESRLPICGFCPMDNGGICVDSRT